MKYYILKHLTSFLNNYSIIKYIKRIDNNTIKIEFNDRNVYYFNLGRGDATIYKKKSTDNIKKDFNAPFDVILRKNFTNSKIKKISLLNNDKIIQIISQSKSSYKTQITILQLEFTGKNTNIIILDEKNIVLEALRHIDEWSSTRIVKVGQKLEPLDKPSYNYEEKVIENIDKFLLHIYESKQKKELESLKKQKLQQIEKQIKKIKSILDNLDNIDVLQEKADAASTEGSIILGDIYKYNGYKKDISINKSNELFKNSKKLKQKIKNQYIEELNLTQKIEFYNRLIIAINNCTTIDEIEFYIPKKDKNQKKTKKAQPYQSFFIDGYKIMLGRDERENIYLLKNSRASDFWFHLQGEVSSHVIVVNTKKTLPDHIINRAAQICVKFSTSRGGVYTVDFTQRRNVKIQTRANVLYNPYSSITINYKF